MQRGALIKEFECVKGETTVLLHNPALDLKGRIVLNRMKSKRLLAAAGCELTCHSDLIPSASSEFVRSQTQISSTADHSKDITCVVQSLLLRMLVSGGLDGRVQLYPWGCVGIMDPNMNKGNHLVRTNDFCRLLFFISVTLPLCLLLERSCFDNDVSIPVLYERLRHRHSRYPSPS